MASASARSPGALRTLLENAIDIHIDLLIVKRRTALDLAALGLRTPVPPDDVLHELPRRQLHVIVVRRPLQSITLSITCVADRHGHRPGRRAVQYLVWALRGQFGGHEEIELAVRLRDIVPRRQARLEEQAGACCVGHLDAVNLDADVPRRLQDVDALRGTGALTLIFNKKTAAARTLYGSLGCT